MALLSVLLYALVGTALALAPAALALPLATGLALIRLGFHYPTAVVGGTTMGSATVIALAVILDAQQFRARPGRPVG